MTNHLERPTYRVLLVEAPSPSRDALEQALVRAGYELVVRGSAAEAMQSFQTTSFDVIVADVSPVEQTGIALLRSVRPLDPDIPVVLVTDAPALEGAMEAMELGAFRYLRRPPDERPLLDVLTRAVQLGRLGRAKQAAFKALGTSTGVSSDRFTVGLALERAIERLWPAFQPVISAKDGSLFGYEALMRTEEPSFPHPGAMLEAAERLGRLDQLARTMRERACSRFLAAEPGLGLHLFLNLHPRDLLDPELLNPRAGVSQCTPYVILEITERATLDEVPDAKQRVAALREAGHRIAVDDLGAGYSGLVSFVELEPELVKLDMSLIRDVDKSPVKQGLVRAMTSVSKDMGLLVVAEGIETEAERDAVIDLGVDLLQGYRFGKPERYLEEPTW